MKYISTRGKGVSGGEIPQPFCKILLEGLAPDGGLYMPECYPQISGKTLQKWRGIFGNGKSGGYANLAFQVLSLYIDDIPPAHLLQICRQTYTKGAFGTDAIVPLTELEQGLHLAGLSNGPTLAFKDIALQLLGNLFEYELNRRGEVLNILGATSGDTGSAAEYAMMGKKGIRVFMLSPQDRMSDFQRAQMYSINDPTIFNLAVDGVFDDCQAIVKALSSDLDFKSRYSIGLVNSINWARIVAQVVYYFALYFQATKDNSETVSFTVPSGNFGNVCAGHVARMMGLPIEQLVVATNENDVLDEFFKTGVYRVRGSSYVVETSSPSMDIGMASNFERFIFDALGRDGTKTAKLFGEQLKASGQFNIHHEMRFKDLAEVYGFTSGRSTGIDRSGAIRRTWEKHGVMIDTHTADALTVARRHLVPWASMVVMETALPAKFRDAIVGATGVEPSRPAHLVGLEDLPQFFQPMPNDAEAVRAFMVSKINAG